MHVRVCVCVCVFVAVETDVDRVQFQQHTLFVNAHMLINSNFVVP